MDRDNQGSPAARRVPCGHGPGAGGRGLLGVLGRLVDGRTAVRLERERRATLQLVLREAPAGTVVDDRSAADRHLTVHLPQQPARVYRVSEPVAARAVPALAPGATQIPDALVR